MESTYRPNWTMWCIAGSIALVLTLGLVSIASAADLGDETEFAASARVAPSQRSDPTAATTTVPTPVPTTTTVVALPSDSATTATTPTATTPTTSTLPAPTPTTTPVPPPPPTTAPPVTVPAADPVSPTTTSPPPPPPETLEQRAERAFVAAVPERWRVAVPVRIEVVEGSTSWSHADGRILVARSHAEARFEHLGDVLAHEFGHQLAFEFGTGAYPGAAPEGWPAPPERPEEAWADCVQLVMTGRSRPSHGLAACAGAQLEWTSTWLGQGPP